MQELISLRDKLQSYKCLPESGYRAVGEHLLPYVLDAIKNLQEYKQSLHDELVRLQFESYAKLADKGNKMYIEGSGSRYEVSVIKVK